METKEREKRMFYIMLHDFRIVYSEGTQDETRELWSFKEMCGVDIGKDRCFNTFQEAYDYGLTILNRIETRHKLSLSNLENSKP